MQNNPKHFSRMVYMAIFLCSIFYGKDLLAQEKKAIELTETDFAKLKNFDARKATVFGVGLNMTVGKAQTIIKKQPYLKLEKDAFNKSRYYLYDVSKEKQKILLGYLKWYPKDSFLQEYVLYQEVTPYLKGLSCNILSADCQNPESDVYKNFLGKAVEEDVILDIPSIPLKTVRYYYPNMSLIIEAQQKDGETKYNLILFDF